jgi:hypothetical protein
MFDKETQYIGHKAKGLFARLIVICDATKIDNAAIPAFATKLAFECLCNVSFYVYLAKVVVIFKVAVRIDCKAVDTAVCAASIRIQIVPIWDPFGVLNPIHRSFTGYKVKFIVHMFT